MGLARKLKSFGMIVRTTPDWYLWIPATLDQVSKENNHPKVLDPLLYVLWKSCNFIVPKRKIEKEINWLVRTRMGARFLVRPGENEFRPVYEVWCDPQRYRFSYLRHYQIKKDDIVVDIGANIGIFSIFAGYQGAHVYAYEPSFDTYTQLLRNIRLNEIETIAAFPLGISAAGGSTELYYSDSSEGASIVPRQGVDSVKIQTIPFDDIFKENSLEEIDFLKMDCEGAEYEILRNVNSQSFRRVRNFAIEYHNGSRELLNIFERFGFSCQTETSSPDMGFIWGSRV